MIDTGAIHVVLVNSQRTSRCVFQTQIVIQLGVAELYFRACSVLHA